MACNTTQNEIGGKELLLKACVNFSAATADTTTSLSVTAHGAVVGDIVKFETIGANTVINATTFYYVKAIVDANTIQISATRSGAAIIFDATEAALDILIFKKVGGLRSKSFSFSSEGIDITNQDSDEWKVMLDQAGIRSLEVSGSGVLNTNDVFESIKTSFLSNSLVCLMFIEYKTGRLYEACFKLTSFEISGEYNGEATYSISAASSGVVTTAIIAA